MPDPEPDGGEPTTELGRLSRALNAMLAQIEAAFTARAASEEAARAAESVARDAAEAAQLSEARAVRSEGKMRQFVADASHELRTPLTTIRGLRRALPPGRGRRPEDVARLVRRIEDEAARMGLLVEDLLLLARLDRERPLTLGPVELPVLALDAVQAAQATAPGPADRRWRSRDEPRAAGGLRRRRPAAPGDRQPDDQRAGAHPAGGRRDAAALGRAGRPGGRGDQPTPGPG